MPISLVQQKQATTTTTTTVEATFDSSPTENNLMVGTVASNDGSFTNPTGWSTAIENYNATDDDIERVIYKVAGAGESATVQCTAFAGNTKHLGISEWSGIVTESPLDLTASSAVTGASTSISSGTTGTINSDNELAVAMVAVRADVGAEAADNSFTVFNIGNGTFSSYAAYRIYGAATTVTTTFSWTTAGTAWGSVATFKGAGGIGPIFRGA